jgi:class 3 adenylate cyclase
MPPFLKTLPLPDDPTLAAWASALNDAGHWATLMDASWQLVFVTDELRLSYGDVGDSTVAPIGAHHFSAEAMRFRTERVRGPGITPEFRRERFLDMGRYVLFATPGGRDELRRVVDPELADLVDALEPRDLPPIFFFAAGMTFAGTSAATSMMMIRIDDPDGRLVGVCALNKPAIGMSQLAVAAAMADVAHLERMRVVESPDRRQAAILMADLEASTTLARRLSSAQYFAFGRRLVRAADQCVIDAGGIVGRHAGDGIVAFFLAQTLGSESAAASACIAAARSLRAALSEIASRSELPEPDCSLRFGLHWGATLYMGRIVTGGRSEVTALGDEVNEAARIEACATGGRALASKSLIERLDHIAADALGLDTNRTTYTPLAELPTATDKARRDAPSIAVCEV